MTLAEYLQSLPGDLHYRGRLSALDVLKCSEEEKNALVFQYMDYLAKNYKPLRRLDIQQTYLSTAQYLRDLFYEHT